MIKPSNSMTITRDLIFTPKADEEVKLEGDDDGSKVAKRKYYCDLNDSKQYVKPKFNK